MANRQKWNKFFDECDTWDQKLWWKCDFFRSFFMTLTDDIDSNNSLLHLKLHACLWCTSYCPICRWRKKREKKLWASCGFLSTTFSLLKNSVCWASIGCGILFVIFALSKFSSYTHYFLWRFRRVLHFFKWKKISPSKFAFIFNDCVFCRKNNCRLFVLFLMNC